MLIKQVLSEVLQLVASQLFTLHAVVFACFRLKQKSWHSEAREGERAAEKFRSAGNRNRG